MLDAHSRPRVPNALQLVVLALGLASGCYLSHERDGDPVLPDAGRRDASLRDRSLPDAPPPRDSGPRGETFWTLEARRALLVIPHELGCTQVEGGRIALQVTAPIMNVCEHGGPVEAVASPDGSLLVTAYLWIEHHEDPDDCPGITGISRQTLLLPASEGTFRATNTDGSSTVEIRVGAVDDLPCSFIGRREAPCLVDCQCERGLVCIPQLGDFVACEGGHCGDPCNGQGSTLAPSYGEHLECPSFESCRPGAAAGSFACLSIEDGGCETDGLPCGPGLTCARAGEPTECAWTIRLSGATRHPCTSDRDCDEGLFCVEHATGERRCDVPCFTNEMLCPPMHVCMGAPWVCEWIGE